MLQLGTLLDEIRSKNIVINIWILQQDKLLQVPLNLLILKQFIEDGPCKLGVQEGFNVCKFNVLELDGSVDNDID